MGVKDLWSVLTPYAERKPISELRGKTVAVDLAGWVCESLNVVDYFVHPKHHLKNLFFRTCYLICEDVTPIFILEGAAPKLKRQVMEKRNEIQFRGVKPRSQPDSQKQKNDKCRTQFNRVLKQCENMLKAMGIQCVQGPGEAEAYCAFLNIKGLVDGVISQDSDCFAYGALRVYRNFSVSTQGALAAQGGAVDIYDMNNIRSKIDFGQNKVIVMALLCGCDYCPDGVGGVGRDSVLKLFNKYKDNEILNRIRYWRAEDDKYTALEMRVDDKTICSNCGHIGRTQSHTKNGCGVCHTNRGCKENLWKEERLALKSELTLRKKALTDPCFPSEEIIEEFLKQPQEIPKLQLYWLQPNMIKFIKQFGNLLQWSELYSFRKFFPILTRWHVLNATRLKEISPIVSYITPKEIIKKRVVKGVPSLELFWKDENGLFNGLIPDLQMKEFLDNNPNGIRDLWSSVEPFDKVKIAYPSLVDSFLQSKEKAKKLKRPARTKKNLHASGSLENLNELIEATKAVAKSIKPKKTGRPKKGIQMIDKFFKQRIITTMMENQNSLECAFTSPVGSQNCSTPITKNVPSDLDSDIDEIFDMSDIVNGIINNPQKSLALSSHNGKQLCYEETKPNGSFLIGENVVNKRYRSVDDFNIDCEKRLLSETLYKTSEAKRQSLDDSFDVLVKKGSFRNSKTIELAGTNRITNFVDRLKLKEKWGTNISKTLFEEYKLEDEKNVSHFFNNSTELENEDAFEKLMEISLVNNYD